MQKRMYIGMLAIATVAFLMMLTPALAGAETGKFEGAFSSIHDFEYKGSYVVCMNQDASGKWHFSLKLNVAFKAYDGEEFLGTGHFNGQINGWLEDLANNNGIIRGNLRIGAHDIKFHIIIKFQDGIFDFKIVPAP